MGNVNESAGKGADKHETAKETGRCQDLAGDTSQHPIKIFLHPDTQHGTITSEAPKPLSRKKSRYIHPGDEFIESIRNQDKSEDQTLSFANIVLPDSFEAISEAKPSVCPPKGPSRNVEATQTPPNRGNIIPKAPKIAKSSRPDSKKHLVGTPNNKSINVAQDSLNITSHGEKHPSVASCTTLQSNNNRSPSNHQCNSSPLGLADRGVLSDTTNDVINNLHLQSSAPDIVNSSKKLKTPSRKSSPITSEPQIPCPSEETKNPGFKLSPLPKIVVSLSKPKNLNEYANKKDFLAEQAPAKNDGSLAHQFRQCSISGSRVTTPTSAPPYHTSGTGNGLAHPTYHIPPVFTYADATNLALKYPELASEFLSRSLSPSKLSRNDGNQYSICESNQCPSSPTIRTISTTLHTVDNPNWAIAPDKQLNVETSETIHQVKSKRSRRGRSRKSESGADDNSPVSEAGLNSTSSNAEIASSHTKHDVHLCPQLSKHVSDPEILLKAETLKTPDTQEPRTRDQQVQTEEVPSSKSLGIEPIDDKETRNKVHPVCRGNVFSKNATKQYEERSRWSTPPPDAFTKTEDLRVMTKQSVSIWRAPTGPGNLSSYRKNWRFSSQFVPRIQSDTQRPTCDPNLHPKRDALPFYPEKTLCNADTPPLDEDSFHQTSSRTPLLWPSSFVTTSGPIQLKEGDQESGILFSTKNPKQNQESIAETSIDSCCDDSSYYSIHSPLLGQIPPVIRLPKTRLTPIQILPNKQIEAEHIAPPQLMNTNIAKIHTVAENKTELASQMPVLPSTRHSVGVDLQSTPSIPSEIPSAVSRALTAENLSGGENSVIKNSTPVVLKHDSEVWMPGKAENNQNTAGIRAVKLRHTSDIFIPRWAAQNVSYVQPPPYGRPIDTNAFPLSEHNHPIPASNRRHASSPGPILLREGIAPKTDLHTPLGGQLPPIGFHQNLTRDPVNFSAYPTTSHFTSYAFNQMHRENKYREMMPGIIGLGLPPLNQISELSLPAQRRHSYMGTLRSRMGEGPNIQPHDQLLRGIQQPMGWLDDVRNHTDSLQSSQKYNLPKNWT